MIFLADMNQYRILPSGFHLPTFFKYAIQSLASAAHASLCSFSYSFMQFLHSTVAIAISFSVLHFLCLGHRFQQIKISSSAFNSLSVISTSILILSLVFWIVFLDFSNYFIRHVFV